MRNLKVLLVVAVVLTLLSPLVFPFAFAYEGWGFDEFSLTHWKDSGNHNDGMGYDMDLNGQSTGVNLTGYLVKVNFQDLLAYKLQWWWFVTEKTLIFTYFFYSFSSYESICVYAYVSYYLTGFGVLHWFDFRAGCAKGADILDEPVYNMTSDLYDLVGGFFLVQLRKVGGFAEITVANQHAGSDILTLVCQTNCSVSSNFWESVQSTTEVVHRGTGTFEATQFQRTVTNNGANLVYLGGNTDFRDVGLGSFFDMLIGIYDVVIPQSVRDYLNTFSGWFDWLRPIFDLLSGLVLALMPLAPFLLVMYGLDVFCSSVDQGSFTPVGEFVMLLWSVVSGLVGALVGIVSTIWDFIHVW